MTRSNLWAILWGEAGQLHKVRIYYDGLHTASWVPCENRRALVRLLGHDDVHVSLVPRTARDDFAIGRAHVLWARLESPECAIRLARFRVPPTLVIREGTSSRRTALWALSEPLEGDWIIRATERLAYALKGRRRAADLSATFPSPFASLTLGRARPSRCFVEYESDTHTNARQIVGGLSDAPALHDWRAARDAA